MPDAGRRISYFETKEALAIDAGRRFEAIDSGTGPSVDGRSHADGGAIIREAEGSAATSDVEAAIGSVVIHVALARMALAPGILVRRDVLRFGVVGGAGIGGREEVAGFDHDAMGGAVVGVAGVIIGGGRVKGGGGGKPRGGNKT